MDEFDEDDEHNSSTDHHKPAASEAKWSDSSAPLQAVSNRVANADPALNYTNRRFEHQAYPGPYQGPQERYDTNPTATVPLVEGQPLVNSHAYQQEIVRSQQNPQATFLPSREYRNYPAGGTEEDVRRDVGMQQNSTVHPSGMNAKHEQQLAFKATAEITRAKASAAHALYATPAETGAAGNDMSNNENNVTTRGAAVTSSGPVVAAPATTHAVATHQFNEHQPKNVTIVQLQQQQLQYKYSQLAPPVSESLVATTSAAAVATNSSSLESETAKVVRRSSATTARETTASRPQAAVEQHQPNVDATTLQQDVASRMSKTGDCNNTLSSHSPVVGSRVVAGIGNRPPEAMNTATLFKTNKHTTSEATANQLNDSKNIETTKEIVVENSGRKLPQINEALCETEAATTALNVVVPKCDQMKVIPDVSNMSTPKRLHNKDSALTDDMYRQSPVANMSSVFATAMTSLYGDLPVDTEPLAHAVFHMESMSSPVAAHSARPSYPHGGPGGGVGAGVGGAYPSHMMFPQFRASPARSPALSIGK